MLGEACSCRPPMTRCDRILEGVEFTSGFGPEV